MANDNWRPKLYIAGIAIGALVGFGTAYLLARTAEENRSGRPPEISTADAIKTAIGVIGVVRGIASLGDR
jgi:gas vesicle protein